jgi:hypothetical protein
MKGLCECHHARRTGAIASGQAEEYKRVWGLIEGMQALFDAPLAAQSRPLLAGSLDEEIGFRRRTTGT